MISPGDRVAQKYFEEKLTINLYTHSNNIEEFARSLYRPPAWLRVGGASVILIDVLDFGLMGLVFGELIYTLFATANESIGSEGLRQDPRGE